MLPKIIDLFSGCGGLALGFKKQGFEVVGGIELDEVAYKTLSYNLDWRYGKKETHICGDITNTDSKVFGDLYGKEGCIVIGGPPCQAYSVAGKGKLRSLGEERCNLKDKRGELYQHFLRIAFELDAKAIIMENVPEAINYGDKNIPEIICKELKNRGYDSYWTILNAADYGVPQIRERLFIIGIKKALGKKLQLPIPTHYNKFGYSTMYQKRIPKFKKYESFIEPLKSKENLPTWITIDEAISDTPILLSSENEIFRPRKINYELLYKTNIKNEYQKVMRNWYGYQKDGVTGNVFRRTTKDFHIFAKMKQGDNYLNAVEIAKKLFESKVNYYELSKGSFEYEKLFNKMIPKYKISSFENKWKRLRADKPSHTLVAHLQKDTYSHIHPWEPRGISVREAARIQSFPDDFFFNCSMGDAYKQIGNAVPPLLANEIAKAIMKAIGE